MRIEVLGTGAIHNDDGGQRDEYQALTEDGEYRLRVALRSDNKKTVQKVVDEVLALYCCGPAGGGGVRQSITSQVSTASVLIDRARVEQHTTAVEVLTS